LLYSHPVTKNTFIGTFALNTVKKPDKYPCAFISNTQNSTHPGEHWVAFFFHSKQGPHEYFDSYGFTPKNQFRRILGRVFKKQRHILQGLTSKVCGFYCVFFVYHRCKNVSYHRVIDHLLSIEDRLRDEHVVRFVRKNFCCNKNTIGFVNKQVCESLKERFRPRLLK